jgi:hypothetical protein
MAGLALLWGVVADRPIFWTGDPPSLASVAGWAVAGGLGGLAMVVLSDLLLDRFAWAKSLAHWFSEVLGPLSWKEALILALLSAFAEEMFFRGAMQPAIGLVPTTLLFGLLHWPPKKELRPWTLLTTALGLAFGLATEASGHLAAAIVAHFVINFINLEAIGKMKA